MPSPMLHTIRSTLAVAVIVTPPELPVRTCGPNVVGPGVVHMYTGAPTAPIRPGLSSGTIPMSAARRSIRRTTACAASSGLIVLPGACGSHNCPVEKFPPNGSVQS